MEYLRILPLTEVLIFNLVTLNCCFKMKYSLIKTAAVFCVFTVFCIYPGLIFISNVFNGNGKFSIFGFLYIIPLKYLYGEKIESILLNMCMSWTYTLGILSISVQITYFLGIVNYNLYLVIIETVLFLMTFIPFKKYVIPKYVYILHNLHDFPKLQLRYLKISVYLNFFMLMILHIIFLKSEKYLLQITALIIFLTAKYLLYDIIYEAVKNSHKINELEKTVSHDDLTGLGNRLELMRRMRILLEENQTFSVMFLDLDKFKLINDKYGHDIGDKYLIHFGKVFSEELKDKGKLYRYGGDEFVAIYYDVLTEETVKSIAQCKNWGGGCDGAPCEFNKVSIGFAVCKPPYFVKDPNAILKRADKKMYKDKLSRRMRNQ